MTTLTLDWCRHPDVDALAERLADDVAGILRAAVRDRGRATLAVPGGTTPARFLGALAAAPLEWSRVYVTLTDERWVPPTDPASNEGLLRRHLLRGPAHDAHLVGLYEPGLDVVDGARAWRPPAFDPPFDVVVVGMGLDGHTASLFPGTASLDDALRAPFDQPVWPVADAPDGLPRVTLTPGRLRRAREVFVLLHGADKHGVFEAALQPGPVEDLPVRTLLRDPDLPVTVYYSPTGAAAAVDPAREAT
ncbi:MAG: 6-phosphogluconolactonase [Alphaproteobacteria bacterium]|nr:6-phosphogluconolactonase [Alphaproteobacteria bacterium]